MGSAASSSSAPSLSRADEVVVEPRENARVFIVGDVHGCAEELGMLIRAAGLSADRGDLVISVGDVIAKGPFSSEALRILREAHALCVRGNHEDAVLQFAKLRGPGGAVPAESDSPATPAEVVEAAHVVIDGALPVHHQRPSCVSSLFLPVGTPPNFEPLYEPPHPAGRAAESGEHISLATTMEFSNLRWMYSWPYALRVRWPQTAPVTSANVPASAASASAEAFRPKCRAAKRVSSDAFLTVLHAGMHAAAPSVHDLLSAPRFGPSAITRMRFAPVASVEEGHPWRPDARHQWSERKPDHLIDGGDDDEDHPTEKDKHKKSKRHVSKRSKMTSAVAWKGFADEDAGGDSSAAHADVASASASSAEPAAASSSGPASGAVATAHGDDAADADADADDGDEGPAAGAEGQPWCRWARAWRGNDMVGPIVFGHHAGAKLQLAPAAVGIDTACVRGGVLTALILEPTSAGDLRDDTGYLVTRYATLLMVDAVALYNPHKTGLRPITTEQLELRFRNAIATGTALPGSADWIHMAGAMDGAAGGGGAGRWRALSLSRVPIPKATGSRTALAVRLGWQVRVSTTLRCLPSV